MQGRKGTHIAGECGRRRAVGGDGDQFSQLEEKNSTLKMKQPETARLLSKQKNSTYRSRLLFF